VLPKAQLGVEGYIYWQACSKLWKVLTAADTAQGIDTLPSLGCNYFSPGITEGLLLKLAKGGMSMNFLV
jgi:hypothetical protein